MKKTISRGKRSVMKSSLVQTRVMSPYVLDLITTAAPVPHAQRSFLRHMVIAGITLCLSASSIGLTYGNITSTISYFRDDEKSQANIFHAGLLGFRVESAGDGYTFDGPADSDGGFHTSFIIPDSGSLPMQFKISIEKTGGADGLCNALNATATTSPFLYDGELLGLGTTTTSHAPFDLNVTLGRTDQLSDGDVCTVDLVYIGWSVVSPAPFGYIDTKRIPLTFTYDVPTETEQSTSESNPDALLKDAVIDDAATTTEFVSPQIDESSENTVPTTSELPLVLIESTTSPEVTPTETILETVAS